MKIIAYFYLIGGGLIAPALMFYLWCKDQHLGELFITFVRRLREQLRLERPLMAIKMAICDVCDERVYLYQRELQQAKQEMLGYDMDDPICVFTMARLKYVDMRKRLYEAEAKRDKAIKDLQ